MISVVLACLTAAGTPSLDVSWHVDRHAVAVGDTVRVVLQIAWAGGPQVYQLQPPMPKASRGIELGPSSTVQRLSQDRTEWRLTYRFVPVEPGNAVIPALTLRYLREGAETWSDTAVPETKITVRSRGSSGGDVPWLVVVVAVAVAGTSAFAYVRHRRRARTGGGAGDTAAQATLQRLAELEGCTDYAAFCQGVSEAIRSYLERAHGVALRGKATDEVLREAKELLGSARWRSVRSVLEDCDRGRFGSLEDADSRERIVRNCTVVLGGERAHED